MAHNGVGEAFNVFAHEFFPPPTDVSSKKLIMTNPFAELWDADRLLEADLTTIFIRIINDNGLAPGLKLCYCGDRPDPAMVDSEKQKPDAAFYREDFAPDDGRPHWGDQLLPWEFKRGLTKYDPYEDVGDDRHTVLPATTGSRKQVRGQLITYSEFLFAAQQRLAVFMPVVHGRRIRFIRWDRSGSIVTESFDYYLNWEFFCDLLWRISCCSDVQLGYDPTAVRLLPGDPDYDKMDQAAIACATDVDHAERPLEEGDVPQSPFVFEYVRTMFRESLHPLWPRYRLQVPDGDQMRYLLVSKPNFRAKGLAGRGTRGYVALDCSTGRFVWLKDAWRAHYLMVEKEGDVLAQLNHADILYVPTLVCHGDINDQDTLTPLWWERKHPKVPGPSPFPPPSSEPLDFPSTSTSLKRKRQDDNDSSVRDTPPPKGLSGSRLAFRSDCPLRLHRHYRLVVEEVAIPLKEFLYGQQLVSIIRDCIYAHWQACTKTNILHRDVSGGNILILPTLVMTDGARNIKWMGMLADWEMSKPIRTTGRPRGPRQPERTGTWQYMSVALLSRSKPVEICDELEAFLYVLIYYAARYLGSNCDGVTIALFLDAFFDTFGFENGNYVCGETKLSAIQKGELKVSKETDLKFNSPMDTILKRLLKWFQAHDRVTEYELRQKERETAAPPSSPTPTLADFPKLMEGFKEEVTGPLLNLDDAEDDDDLPPSAKEQELASFVLDHNPILQYLKQAIPGTTKSRWSRDKAGDKVPRDWKALQKLPDLSTMSGSGSGSVKKPRIDGIASAPAFAMVPRWAAPTAPVTPPRRGQSTWLGKRA